MPDRVQVFDTELGATDNPVLMYQVDIQEAMRREPERFTFDEADYKKRHKPSKAKKDDAKSDVVDPVTMLDRPRVDLAQDDAKAERRRLADLIEQKTGKRPPNFVGVDELRTTLSQINGKPLAEENKGPEAE
jgi:hypothetical protein